MESLDNTEQIESGFSEKKSSDGSGVNDQFSEIVQNNINNDSESIIVNMSDIDVPKSESLKTLCNDADINVNTSDIVDSVLQNLEASEAALLNNVEESVDKQNVASESVDKQNVASECVQNVQSEMDIDLPISSPAKEYSTEDTSMEVETTSQTDKPTSIKSNEENIKEQCSQIKKIDNTASESSGSVESSKKDADDIIAEQEFESQSFETNESISETSNENSENLTSTAIEEKSCKLQETVDSFEKERTNEDAEISTETSTKNGESVQEDEDEEDDNVNSKQSKTNKDAETNSSEENNLHEKSSDAEQNSETQDKAGVDFENDERDNTEKTVFVHVSTENEKEDKSAGGQDMAGDDDEPQEDPIASDGSDGQIDEDSNNIDEAEQQGADEELCIIPDTERIISQEEKEAAAAMIPLRDPAEVISAESGSNDSGQLDGAGASKEKYIVATNTDENVHTCVQCCLPRKSKYTVTLNTNTSYVCDDNCLSIFKSENNEKNICLEGDLRVKNLSDGVSNDNMIAKVNFIRKCSECNKKVTNQENNLSWETMDFCNEFCLAKHQKKIGSNCASCQSEVRSNCLGKYCVRFGYDIRQFCSSSCLEEYKKGLKVCSYCQKDMSGAGDGFLAPVGDKGQFKDFCSQNCMDKYDVMSNNKKLSAKTGLLCSVCLNEKPITIEFNHDNKLNLFCSEPCFVAFKFVNNITPGKCDMCKNYVDNKILEENCIFYDGAQHSFCSKSCQNIYIISHRKIVPCSWCKVKKYNFDMIKKAVPNGQVLMMCSLNCLNLYQVSVNAVNSRKIKCDHCLKFLHPLYHLTMSDATIRNFCSYSCVMAFQNQFSKAPITLNEVSEDVPVPTGAPKRTRRATAKAASDPLVPADVPTIPVITSVQSLASTNGPSTVSTRSSRSKSNALSTATSNNSSPANSQASTQIKTQIKQQIIVKPRPLPMQRNIATMCKVISTNKGTSCKPCVTNKETQTTKLEDKKILIPIPVPIYVPCPMAMYSMPYPVPIPFPLPVPVPIFIPTTRNSANGIMKEIKKIQVKIPTDPFEAELLMMAEMVAADKKEENTDSDSGEDDDAAGGPEDSFSPEPVDTSNAFGEDVLQMALKMATELDEPAVDLEGALTANTITASQTTDGTGNDESVDDPQPMHSMMERQSMRGRKRGMRGSSRAYPSKRGRRSTHHQQEMQMLEPPQPPAPPEPVEKPDANMCLKYTFGVNAWKQWVTTKNAELEKSSKRVILFKPEILQLTADELNYSLCLFVKEVRKPNGQEYAPDTIYYLCLGIQQYLFENGRIDNIFCDPYYEKFTDCLDEVARKFSVLYNDSHYIVTRVEEEHLWESKQLGAHSPHVLLSTLVFFNTKHFNLTTVDEHMQLSFSHIMKHWKRNPNQPGGNKTGTRNVLLRFYPPQSALGNARKKKVYEQQENEENPLRCPVKLYEFYLTKCPESVKTRNDVFYLMPERSCVPDSPVWYSTMPLPKNALEKMLHRVKMVKEINVALLTS
ncbi:zinc finger MYM-type protein 3 isoform X2 [Agrilus planipennis]|uniref:Zinc finger MYM-type protein 3 isoform X2 n=1 Tax=Agrilus planipennis TaxID=224129 RepID=A0A1W4X120_AGRPL|nr:zinc finger MYM-type protein 3 isoform X2 [Agrilus planipennis]